MNLSSIKILILLIIISCKNPKINYNEENHISNIENKINQKLVPFKIKICISNTIDTTKIYDSLFYKIEFSNKIKYLNNCFVVKNLIIKDSTKMFVEFNLQEGQYGLKNISFYNYDKTIRFIYAIDTILKNVNPKVSCNEIRKTYNNKGNLIETSYYGHYGPWGVPVGTSKQYDLNSNIITETSYQYWNEREGKKTTIRYDKGVKNEILIEQYDTHYGERDTIRYWKNKTKSMWLKGTK